MEALKELSKKFTEEQKKVKNLTELEALVVEFLGRKGALADAMKDIAKLDDVAKREFGKAVNAVKTEIEETVERIKTRLLNEKESEALKAEAVDITQPKLPRKPLGHVHPIVKVRLELEDKLKALGFSVLDGPELESDFFNFESLNIPETHPARDMQDTFYIDGHSEMVMRTHTSPMQVRAFLKYGAPIRAIVPGRVFRNEATDVRHEHTFDQVEGFVVDKNISISHLLGVMGQIMEIIFGKKVSVRLRPGHFNFVEPGFEMDMACLNCGGSGCGVCKHVGWVEIVGCGLIHPKVLEYGNIDSKKYSGFAFGFGLTRLVMMKYGIEDIRLFNSGDLRFLNQF